MSRILEIKEVFDQTIKDDKYSKYDGYILRTTTKDYKLLISNNQSCCEDYGQIISNDDLGYYVGAEIKSIECVENGDYKKIKLTKDHAGKYVDVYDCAFIELNTTKGILQLAVYNSHNGYYGHNIKIIEENTTPL